MFYVDICVLFLREISRSGAVFNFGRNRLTVFLSGFTISHSLYLHLMWRADSLEETLMLGKVEGRRRRGWQRMRWSVGITDSMYMKLSKFWEIIKDREAWCAAVHGFVRSQTRLSDWTTFLPAVDVSSSCSTSISSFRVLILAFLWHVALTH